MSRASDYGGYACPKCGGKTTVWDSRLDGYTNAEVADAIRALPLTPEEPR